MFLNYSPEYLSIQRVRGNTKEQHVPNAFCSFIADNMTFINNWMLKDGAMVDTNG